MPKMNWGDRMPSTYLETFKAQPGIQSRIAVLSLESLVAVECHWVDTPSGTKGFYECVHGTCCQLSNVSQYYALPIWVYLNPPNPQTGNPGSQDGQLKVLRMSKTVYDMLVQIGNTADLTQIDLVVISQQSGKGAKMSFIPDMRMVILDQYQRQQIVAEMGDAAQVLENTLMRRATEADWAQIAAEMNGQPLGGGHQAPVGFAPAANPQTMFSPQPQRQQIAAPGSMPGFQPQAQPMAQPQQPARPMAPQQFQPAQPVAQPAGVPVQAPQAQAPIGFNPHQPMPAQRRPDLVQPVPSTAPRNPAQGFPAPAAQPVAQPVPAQPQYATYQAPTTPVVADQFVDTMSAEEMDSLLGDAPAQS